MSRSNLLQLTLRPLQTPALLASLALLTGGCSSSPERASIGPVVPELRGPEVIELGASLAVRGDVQLVEREYLRPTPTWEEAVIVLEGLSDVTVDLGQASLRGAPEGTPLDELVGTGILVRDCRGVTLRGGRLGGYRVCVAVERSRDVVVEDMQLEGWYGQRLRSTIAAPAEEDVIDLELPGDRWRGQHGAAVWVGESRLVEVRRCTGRDGQNGIVLVDSEHCELYDNDLSFLSGWGIALWASSSNRISHNILDYVVRGYSHDVYAADQGSAALLLAAGSSDNVFASNSATHTSYGALVLGEPQPQGSSPEQPAGLARVDAGGCDRNSWLENDFRSSILAGIQLEGSMDSQVLRNRFSGGLGSGVRILEGEGCWVVGNELEELLGRGIQLLGGVDCLVAENSLRGDQIALEVTSGGLESSGGGHWLQANTLSDNDQDLVLKGAQGFVLADNAFLDGRGSLYVEELTVRGRGVLPVADAREFLAGRGGDRPGGFVQGAQALPWDGEDHPSLYEARTRSVHGVQGEQRAVGHAGQLDALSSILVGEFGAWDHRSGDPRPEVRFPGGLFQDCEWDAVWFHWGPDSDPRGERDVWRARRFTNVAREQTRHFRNPWGSGRVRQALGLGSFGLIATTSLEVPTSGTYQLTVVSDDGVRLCFGEETVLEDWTWHPRPRKQTALLELEAGTISVELEYFQVEGAAALSIELDPIDA